MTKGNNQMKDDQRIYDERAFRKVAKDLGKSMLVAIALVILIFWVFG